MRVNREIRISPVRLIDHNNEQVGIVDLQEAYRRAEEAELDLVEVAPNSRPPVCRIMDYGKFRYEETKKEQRARAKSKAAEMKEVRLGRTIKVDQHDIDIRVKRARKFLLAGHKVQITQQFRGREMMHRDLGRGILDGVFEQLKDIGLLERPPRQVGNRMHIIVAPDKDRIRMLAKEAEAEAAALEADDDLVDEIETEDHEIDDESTESPEPVDAESDLR
jgi:translation initiation factor IF-3